MIQVRPTAFNVSTILLMAFTCFVIYVRLRAWLDSNIPVFFYALMLVYINMWAANVPPLVIYIGLVLTLLLRFEFMNSALGTLVRFAEIAILAGILYECGETVFAW